MFVSRTISKICVFFWQGYPGQRGVRGDSRGHASSATMEVYRSAGAGAGAGAGLRRRGGKEHEGPIVRLAMSGLCDVYTMHHRPDQVAIFFTSAFQAFQISRQ